MASISAPPCCFAKANGDICSKKGKFEYDGQRYCGTHLKVLKSKEDCAICLCPMTTNKPQKIHLSCGHYFHNECLSHCQKAECPLCKSPFNEEDAYTIYSLTVIKPLAIELFRFPVDFHGYLVRMFRLTMSICRRGGWYLNMMNVLLTTIDKAGTDYQKIERGVTSLINNLQ